MVIGLKFEEFLLLEKVMIILFQLTGLKLNYVWQHIYLKIQNYWIVYRTDKDLHTVSGTNILSCSFEEISERLAVGDSEVGKARQKRKYSLNFGCSIWGISLWLGYQNLTYLTVLLVKLKLSYSYINKAC